MRNSLKKASKTYQKSLTMGGGYDIIHPLFFYYIEENERVCAYIHRKSFSPNVTIGKRILRTQKAEV